MPEEVSYYEDFSEIQKKVWSLLTDAVKNRDSEFRTPVFICGGDKDLDGRVVVLRKADSKNNFLQFHSDIRSNKIKILNKKLLICPIHEYWIDIGRHESLEKAHKSWD